VRANERRSHTAGSFIVTLRARNTFKCGHPVGGIRRVRSFRPQCRPRDVALTSASLLITTIALNKAAADEEWTRKLKVAS